MSISLTKREIIRLYNYFDPKHKGQIIKDQFLKRLEVVGFLALLHESSESEEEMLANKLSQRQKVLDAINKIYVYCQ